MKHLATQLALLLAASGVNAAPFADPFRPPREIEPPTASVSAATGAPRLESVLIALRRPGRDEVLKLYPQDIKRASVGGNEGR